ncbi:hypothetical protein B857_01949 [Solibacillus isronensis B3W22]|uniref:Uncharacterized protein n=1 Tax=Solibacillus isronensis B3W22 TaxID=1224748 RepID=K1KSA2_9BACL|nr:hypothetical protein B857_01949 [Solibacillus isronensis B3W22]
MILLLQDSPPKSKRDIFLWERIHIRKATAALALERKFFYEALTMKA